MAITPTPVTAALAGLFSAVAWPPLWQRFGGDSNGGMVELVVATLLVVALPAHAFVVGMGAGAGTSVGGSRVDKALLQRIAAWLFTAVVVSGAARLLQPA